MCCVDSRRSGCRAEHDGAHAGGRQGVLQQCGRCLRLAVRLERPLRPAARLQRPRRRRHREDHAEAEDQAGHRHPAGLHPPHRGVRHVDRAHVEVALPQVPRRDQLRDGGQQGQRGRRRRRRRRRHGRLRRQLAQAPAAAGRRRRRYNVPELQEPSSHAGPVGQRQAPRGHRHLEHAPRVRPGLAQHQRALDKDLRAPAGRRLLAARAPERAGGAGGGGRADCLRGGRPLRDVA
mmetsp:Transcript_33143/g.103309  ORF Transcript_33143/g.103309 Transcript_33143/m.103309 type:complete len:234 (-) Transcript_33143:3123-3824(-)